MTRYKEMGPMGDGLELIARTILLRKPEKRFLINFIPNTFPGTNGYLSTRVASEFRKSKGYDQQEDMYQDRDKSNKFYPSFIKGRKAAITGSICGIYKECHGR